MNNTLNLASKPFNNRILPWILTIAILSFALIGLVLVVHLTTQVNSQAAVDQAEIARLRKQEQALLTRVQEVKNSLTPEQQQALRAAHELVDRKAFSWSRLFADLESSLPGNVRVSRIAVRNIATHSDQTVAELELAVFAKSPTTITDMISAMDRGGTFRAELLSQNLQKGRGETGTEYELLVVYRPRPGYVTENIAEIQKQSSAKEEGK